MNQIEVIDQCCQMSKIEKNTYIINVQLKDSISMIIFVLFSFTILIVKIFTIIVSTIVYLVLV